jgi:TPR repeat protein
MLGILMLEGTGVEKSAAGAAKLFEKASVDNDMVAVYNLGVLLQTGRGVKLSPNKGAELIRKAATAGTAEAQFAVSQWFSTRQVGARGAASGRAAERSVLVGGRTGTLWRNRRASVSSGA